MKYIKVRKIVSIISSFSLLFQSFLPLAIAMPVYAEDATESAVVEVTPTPEVTPEPTAEPTPEVTPEVTPEITPEPTVEVTPEPTLEITPEVTPTPEVTIEITPEITPKVTPEATPTEEQAPEEVQNNSPPAEDQSSSESTPSETTPEATLPADLTIVAQLEQAITPEIIPTLSTDKADYFPTDTVHITGVNFLPNTTYTLHISSQDNPIFNFSPEVTSDENGSISFSFVLDGNYRPNYSIDALDASGLIVASYEFTDVATGTLFPNGQGNYTSWTGDEDDVDETGSADCEDDNHDGDDNISESTTNDRESVLIDLSSIPNGSTITSVDVYVTHRNGNDGGADNGTFQTFARLNGVNQDSGSNLISTNTTCTPANQNINVSDTVKSGTTTLEVGVVKTGADNSEVWVGTIRAVVNYSAVQHVDVRVCHASGASGNYQNLTVDDDSVVGASGHGGHSNDIIPPFTYYGGNYPGLNWTIEGQAIWNNNCVVPPTTGSITIVKSAIGGDETFNFSTDGKIDEFVTEYSITTINGTGNIVFNNLKPDRYQLYENIPSDWDLTDITCVDPDGQSGIGSGDPKLVTIDLDAGEAITCTFTNTKKTGSVPGYKFNDQNGDGNWDIGEPQLAGWTFELRNQAGAVVQTAVSTMDGFSFSDVPFGSYLVCEQAQDGWTQTYPAGCWSVALDSNGSLPSSTIFGNHEISRTGSLKIIKDSQPNDTQNFIFDVFTTAGPVGSTELDDDGANNPPSRSNTHTFENLPSGGYTISERSVSGWYLDSASCTGSSDPNSWNFTNGSLNVIISNGEDFVCTFVNNKAGSISGYKFNDRDGDKNWDGGESGLSGWTIYLDQNDNLTLDPGETSTVTNSSGFYKFSNLPLTSYYIREVGQDSWTQTTPYHNDGSHYVTLDSSHRDRSGYDFGNRQRGSIRVCKMIIDGNRNIVNGSEMDSTTFRIDWNKGLPDTVFTTGYTPNTQLLAGSNGNDAYCETFEDLAIDNYGYSQEVISGSTGWETALYNDQYTANIDTLADFYPYGTNTDSNGDINLALDAGPNRTLVILNQYQLGSIHGFKWNDLNGDGDRDTCLADIGEPAFASLFDITDIDPEPCTNEELLPGWTINLYRLTEGDGGVNRELVDTKVTDGGDSPHYGWYWFENLPSGQYEVCEVGQAGWTQTYPLDPICHVVTLPDTNPRFMNVSVNFIEQPTPEYNFGNQRVDARLLISRSNNAGAPLTPGSSVEHTITIKVEDNDVRNLKLTDLLPAGFTFRVGSYTLDVNGTPFTLCFDPVYNSPGEWELGSFFEGDVITIKYIADIASDINPGTYADLAWAVASDAYDQGLTFLALGENSEFVDGNYVGTDVEVVKDQSQGGTYDVEKKVEGEVLGASTSLPATGASPIWLMLSLVCFVYGTRLIKSAKKS